MLTALDVPVSFLLMCWNAPTKATLMGERFYLAYNSKLQSIIVGMSRQELETASDMTLQSRAERNECKLAQCSALSLQLRSPGPKPWEWYHPQWVVFLPHLTKSRQPTTPRYLHRPAWSRLPFTETSHVILDVSSWWLKLTIAWRSLWQEHQASP